MVSAAAVADQSAVIIIETVAAGGAVQSVWWHTESGRAAKVVLAQRLARKAVQKTPTAGKDKV